MKKLCICIFILFISLNTFGQKKLLKEVDERKIIQLLGDSLTVEASVKSFDIKVKPSRRYFWYWKGDLKSNIGGYHGILLHGSYVKYDLDKNLLEKAYFKKGLVKGKYFFWNTNGEYAKIEKWKKGVKKGKYIIYGENGELSEIGKMKNNLKHGKVVNYQRDGKPEIVKYRKGLVKTSNSDKAVKKENRIIEKNSEKGLKGNSKKLDKTEKSETKKKEEKTDKSSKEKKNKSEKQKSAKTKKTKK